MKCLLVLLVGILVACDAPRPAGAFTPEEPPEAKPDYTEENDAADQAGGDDLTDDPPDEPTDKEPEKDASTKPMDAGEPAVPATGPYARLAGKYLMRMDMYSTVNTENGRDRLRVDNRVSNLWWVTLTVQDGKLISDEKLCDQSYLHTCREGCTEWTTKLDVALKKSFFPNSKVRREYTIVDGTLTAGEVTLPLGFDAENPTPATPLPKSPSDPSVWKLAPASTPDPNRAGVRTVLAATLKNAAGLTAAFKCAVVTVQSLTTSFSMGGIDESDRETLTGAYHKLNADPSKLDTIYVDGSGGSSLTSDFCKLSSFQNQTAIDPIDVVKFKRADDMAGCPATIEEWEKTFPGSPSRPAVQ